MGIIKFKPIILGGIFLLIFVLSLYIYPGQNALIVNMIGITLGLLIPGILLNKLMNKELEKLLFNPVRLKILSFLFSVENASFKKLMEVSGATKGNISVQIKKLEDAELIKVRKKFEGNYPLTLCKITSKGKTSFKVFLKSLQSYGINQSADIDF